MSPFRHAARLVGAAVAGLLLAAAPGLPSFAASSPIELASSSPAADQSLSAPPSSVRLQFAQALDGREVGIAVACGGLPANVGAPAPDPDGRSVEATLTGTQVGTCNVSWTVASTPAPIAGSYSFVIEAAADPSETTTPSSETSDTDATTTDTSAPTTTTRTAAATEGASNVGGPLGLARLFSFIGILALFGALVLIALAWAEGVEYLVTLRYLRVVWIIGAVATIGVVIFSTARLPGNSVGGSISPASWGDLFDTTVGKALLARLLLVLASGWVAWQPDRVTDPATQLVAIAVPGLAVVMLGVSRSGGSAAAIGYLAGAVQALGASVWFGGLLLLTRAVLVGAGEEDLVHAVRGYIRLAPAAIAATVIGGLIQVYRLDGLALLTTGHGRLAILSGLAIAAAIYLGTATRQFASQRLANADHLDGRMAHRLRRAFTIEALIGIGALLLTAWMLALTPPKIVAAESSDSTTYAFVSETTPSPFQVRLKLTSQTVGDVGMRLEIFEPTKDLSGVTVTFIPPDAAYLTTSKIVVTVPLTGAGAAVLPKSEGIPLTVSGTWTVDISAQVPGQTLPIARATVEVGAGTGTGTTEAPGDTVASTDTTVAADPAAATTVAVATSAP
jgi:copper transport protein